MIKPVKFTPELLDKMLIRSAEQATSVEQAVRGIIENVRQNGDSALRQYCAQFDGVELDDFRVSEEEFAEAERLVGGEYAAILERSANNIAQFHKLQLRKGFELKGDGFVVGQKVIPVESAGLYVPGGTAAYPSTVLMDAIPAKIAGCQKLVMVTPPGKDGRVNPAILAAAKVAGVDEIYKIGGAQAIAALAYGTQSVPQVDKIVGPGNAFVAEAKRQVYGQVAIDMIAGPSEILIVADGSCSARNLAADLLSQAEHDKNASAVLVTDSETLAQAVAEELEVQLQKLAREEIARASIENNGKIILTSDLNQAIAIANEIAPEHLELCVDDPFAYLDRIVNAGSIFMGKYCPEALGDYFAGPNHTLPTSGTARFSSPLSVDDFVKKTQYTYYTKQALGKVANQVATFATQEGLGAHARSALVRLEEE